MQGNSPPAIHMHFTVYSIDPKAANAPPLGTLPDNAEAAALDSPESSPEQRKIFDDWLLKRWREKDERMNQFYKDGDFVQGTYAGKAETRRYVEIPVELKSLMEFVDLFLWGGPIALLYLLYKLFR